MRIQDIRKIVSVFENLEENEFILIQYAIEEKLFYYRYLGKPENIIQFCKDNPSFGISIGFSTRKVTGSVDEFNFMWSPAFKGVRREEGENASRPSLPPPYRIFFTALDIDTQKLESRSKFRTFKESLPLLVPKPWVIGVTSIRDGIPNFLFVYILDRPYLAEEGYDMRMGLSCHPEVIDYNAISPNKCVRLLGTVNCGFQTYIAKEIKDSPLVLLRKVEKAKVIKRESYGGDLSVEEAERMIKGKIKGAKGWAVKCPFHDDKRESATIFSDMKGMYCHVCGKYYRIK